MRMVAQAGLWEDTKRSGLRFAPLTVERNPIKLAIKLVIFAIIYGFFFINLIDLNMNWSRIMGPSLFISMLYFIPFFTGLIFYGKRAWELTVANGILASSMNDLFYGPVGMIFGMWQGSLIHWFLWQLGFYGFEYGWTADFLFFKVPVLSIVMGISIYVRLIITALLLKRWLHRANV